MKFAPKCSAGDAPTCANLSVAIPLQGVTITYTQSTSIDQPGWLQRFHGSVMAADEAAAKVLTVNQTLKCNQVSRFGAAGRHYGAAGENLWRPPLRCTVHLSAIPVPQLPVVLPEH
jgi:hypothetical protein